MKQLLAFIFLSAIALFGMSFAVLNGGRVTVNYYFGVSDLPLAMLLVVTLALGAIAGAVAVGSRMLVLQQQMQRLRRRAAMAEEEINNLRRLPLKDHS